MVRTWTLAATAGAVFAIAVCSPLPGQEPGAHPDPTAAARQEGARNASTPAARPDSPYERHFVGSTLFLLGNLLPESPEFLQLNYGYRLTPRDALSVEVITWRYYAPLGIPYGSSYGSAEEKYPGSVRELGMGVAYQRMLWRGLYSAAHVLPLLQRYQDENGAKIQNGFELFLTGRIGYQVPLFSGRWFLEPSLAATAWPINTNVPEAFAEVERRWPRYFLGEPGLHFGRRF